MSEAFAERLFQAGSGRVTIDLRANTVTAHLAAGDVAETFSIPEGARTMLLEGRDEISGTLRHAAAIAAYEAAHPELVPH